MGILTGNRRAALGAAGAGDERATQVATYEVRLANVETRLSVLTWMVGANLALTLLVLGKLFHG
ncbi:hypothetical protein [Lichenicoccus sp.]|uniref:hypothetical protein n=1 Tax=Lichenicoccus sp. TaxID=2781899 RepID=UPI003D12440E